MVLGHFHPAFWVSILCLVPCLLGSLVSLSSTSLSVCPSLCVFLWISLCLAFHLLFPCSPQWVSSMFLFHPLSLVSPRSLSRLPLLHSCVKLVCRSCVPLSPVLFWQSCVPYSVCPVFFLLLPITLIYPSCVSFLPHHPHVYLCVAIIQWLSGHLLCSRHVSRFPRIHTFITLYQPKKTAHLLIELTHTSVSAFGSSSSHHVTHLQKQLV